MTDIEQARDFHDCLQPGIGKRCVDALWADITRLVHAHGIHPVHCGFHRALSARFPFGIYYREMPTRTEVFAVLDLRREPGWLDGTLDGRAGLPRPP